MNEYLIFHARYISVRLHTFLTFQKNENSAITGYKDEIEVLKGRVTDLKNVEKQLKTSNNQINELEARIAKLIQEVEVRFHFEKKNLEVIRHRLIEAI